MVRNVKGEPSGSGSKVNGASRGDRGESDHNEGDDQNEGNGLERRVLRSRYLAVKNLISGNPRSFCYGFLLLSTPSFLHVVL